MVFMSPNDLRQKYLNFFKERGHAIVPSASLVPENDPTTLFTGSGMQPMIEYFLGAEHPKGTRVTDSQKSFRSQDIEEVGDNRHTTYFEMLGNWSFGDYFKSEQLGWFFEFLTTELGLDPQRLYATVYAGNPELNIPKDTESVQIWQQLFAAKGVEAKAVADARENGLQAGRIFYYQNSNWWSRAGAPEVMPAGEPGGPDSEIFYDFGAELGIHEQSKWASEPCHVNCDCGRFLEIGNSVFMQYQKQPDGSFADLPKKNVDFGGGLERILAVVNHDPDIFKTEFFTPIIQKLETVSGAQYNHDEAVNRSFRVIADHLRAAVMLADDGVYPDNKEQGYFSRRLVRRAIRYAKMIGITKPFIGELVGIVAEIYREPYPSVVANQEKISAILIQEELKFERTLEKGLRELEKIAKLDGETAFHLYETYGFPFELTQEIAAEKGQHLEQADFDKAKATHAAVSRTAAAGKFRGGLADQSEQTTQFHTATHLLHAALRQVLGQHVEQRGSNITEKRLRFDFTHSASLTAEEKSKVEQMINDWIKDGLPVVQQTMSKEAALNSGALAFFREKYADEVSVFTIGKDRDKDWISRELCGGPHVSNTNEITPVEIFKEKSAGAGIRRLYLRVRQ